MLIPSGSSLPTDWSSDRAAIQNSSSNAWSGSKIAAVTLGIILGVIVVGTLLCFALYIHRFIRDVEAAINNLALRRGRSKDQRSDRFSRPSPSSSGRTRTQNMSPAALPPDEEGWRQPTFEQSIPTPHIISPQMGSPLSRSPDPFQYPPSGYGSPQSSYERERPRQCNIGDLPTILPRMSAHGSDSPTSPSPRIERGPRERNVGEFRAVVRRASSGGSDYPRRGPPSFWYLSSQRISPPPPPPPPSPERGRETERRQREGQRPIENNFPAVVRRESSRQFISPRRNSSRQRTDYVPPHTTSAAPSDRRSSEDSRG